MSFVLTPLPGGRIFKGSVQSYLATIQSEFDRFYSYFQQYHDLFTPFALDIYSEDTGRLFDESWESDLRRIFSDKVIHDKVFFEHDFGLIENDFLRNFFKDSTDLYLEREKEKRESIDVMKYQSLQGMSGFDKSQEVIYLSYAIDVLLSSCYEMDDKIFHGEAYHKNLEKILKNIESDNFIPKKKLSLKRENISFIDVGAGKGYFSVFLTSQMRMKTLTIEASLSHASHLRNRIGCLISQKKLNPKSLDLMDMCIGYMTTQTNVEAIYLNSMKYEKWDKTIKLMEQQKSKNKNNKIDLKSLPEIEDVEKLRYSEQSRKPRVIQGELAVEIIAVPDYNLKPTEYITVGLHACGDLSIVTHEIALNSSQARGAISVPCCFQHLSKSRLPLLSENKKICDLLFGDNETKRHNLLNYALYEYDASFEKHNQSLEQFLSRAIIECFIPPRVTIKKIKQMKDEKLEDYILRLTQHFNKPSDIEDIRKKIKQCQEEDWKMMAHTLFREQFGHLFESFLLLERLTYFAKIVNQKEDQYFVGMFDLFSHLSPRGFSLFTLKLNE